MIELLAALSLLIPLLLCLWSLLGLQDLQWTVTSAARYAAFDAAFRQDVLSHRRGPVIPPIASRLFDAGVERPEEPSEGASGWQRYPSLWGEPASGRAWMPDRRSISTSIIAGAVPGDTARATRVALALVAPARALSRGSFEIASGGFVRAQVSAKAEGVGVLDGDNLVLSDGMSLLTESWAAANPVKVVQQVGGLAPNSWFAVIDRWLAPLRLPIVLLEPAFADFCPGIVAPDVVPRDRLEPRTVALARHAPC